MQTELIKAVSGRAVVARHSDYAMYRPSAVSLARVVVDFPVILVQVSYLASSPSPSARSSAPRAGPPRLPVPLFTTLHQHVESYANTPQGSYIHFDHVLYV